MGGRKKGEEGMGGNHSSLAVLLAPSLPEEEVKGKGVGIEEASGGALGALEQ